MSLVDIPSPTAEDQTMDPALKQYVDASLGVSEARFDTKLADFRTVIEAYTARAEEREAAARDREAAAREHDKAAREAELLRIRAFEQRLDAYNARSDEREAAARAREATARRYEALRSREVARRMKEFESTVSSVKRAVITTGIAATLSTVLGVGAFNAALMQSMYSAIELGRQATPAQIKMQSDIDEIKRRLSWLEDRLR